MFGEGQLDKVRPRVVQLSPVPELLLLQLSCPRVHDPGV